MWLQGHMDPTQSAETTPWVTVSHTGKPTQVSHLPYRGGGIIDPNQKGLHMDHMVVRNCAVLRFRQIVKTAGAG